MSAQPQPRIIYSGTRASDCEAFANAFDRTYDVSTCLSAEKALAELAKAGQGPKLLVTEHLPPALDGIELCRKAAAKFPDSGRLAIVDNLDRPEIQSAIREGVVQDFVARPWTRRRLEPVLRAIFENHWRRFGSEGEPPREIEERPAESYDFRSLIGASGGLRRIVELIRKVAPTDLSVLISGETGTGKEVVAQALHANSRRRAQPFVAVHCAALAATVIESELFGHEKGAFTGADASHVGRFESANGGTLFLDELSEIPLETQVKLLRVLQEKVIFRVGGTQPIPVDIRLLSATNRDLLGQVRTGKFREDLYFRLNVVPITIPPLRERREDIPLLASYFLRQYCVRMGVELTLSEEAASRLGAYDWPGNVRELHHALERAALFARGKRVEADDLVLDAPAPAAPAAAAGLPVHAAGGEPLRGRIRREEAEALEEALRRANGNVTEAARAMNLPRTTLLYRLRKHGLA
jgi:DNA-binding NtrC family response regulator